MLANTEEIIFEDSNGNYIAQRALGRRYEYAFYSADGTFLDNRVGPVDLGALSLSQLRLSTVFKTFTNTVRELERLERQESLFDRMRNYSQNRPSTSSLRNAGSFNDSYWYPEPKRGYVDKYCNSDTLVFHKADPSTAMLSQVYDGKGWDVITDTGIARDELRELIERHDRIICLGHGTPRGLIGGNITAEEAPYLRGKKVFAIWCYAATFFKSCGLTGQGILCSDNCPSEKWECRAACGADVSAKWIFDNITYWSKCMADVCEMALEGNPEKACEIAKKNYYKTYAECQTDDERKVVEFNTNTIQVV